MKTTVQPGESITITAGAQITSGSGVLTGAMFGIAATDAANGKEVELAMTGVFDLPKTASQPWTVGAPIYWDDAGKEGTTVDTANTVIGLAVLAFLDWPAGIGVAHGWTPISEPIKVTRAEHDRLIELNYRPAFEVYREVIAEHLSRPLDPECFFTVATACPFGIRKMGGEVVVRDPILLNEDGGTVCVGEVPTSSLVHILRGDTAG